MKDTAMPISPTRTVDAENAVTSKEQNLKARAIEELKSYAMITLYIWVLMVIFRMYRQMILQEHGINVWAEGFAIVNALIFGKVILIGEAFKLGASLRKYPLIYTVLGNSLGFAVGLIIFHVIEGAIRATVKGLPLSSSIADFGGGTIFGFLTVGVIFFFALIPLFVFKEVGRVVGVESLWNLFFSPRAKTFRLVQD